MSLLAVNSLEVHGMVHQISSQSEKMLKLSENIEANSKFMKRKTEDLASKLKEIE